MTAEISKYTTMTREDFSHYLAGLIEGDGTIYVPISKYSVKGKKNYPSIQIAFNQKDGQLAMAIVKVLGAGSVAKKKGKNALTLTVNSLEGVQQLVELLNGKMRTPKIKKLHKLIDWLEEGSNEREVKKIEKKGINTEPVETNYWLAGFIEADGHFGVRATIGQDITEESFKELQKELGQNLKRGLVKYSRVECRWELSQAQTRKMRNETVQEDDDMGEVMGAIAKYVGSSLERIREERKNENPQYRIRAGSLSQNERVEAYLEKYQLFSSKYLDYKDWREVLQYFKSKSGREGLIKVALVKRAGMNDSRTNFDWTHLVRLEIR